MQLRTFPATGLKVSQLTLGTMTFGGQTDERASFAIMDMASAGGINIFDTANTYNQGESERIVGKWLKGRRADMLLATKVRGQMGDGPNDVGLSRHNIMRAAEKSLTRLQTDYIDIYYLHMPDYATGIEESLRAMDDLVRQGKVRYVGISNYAAWQAADILAIADKRGLTAPVITQNVYNLITRGVEAEFLPFLRAHPMAMTVYNPIAGGLLTGKHRKEAPDKGTRFDRDANYYKRYWSEENLDAVDKLSAVAGQAGISLLQLAYRWLAQNPLVTTILSGVSNVQQLEQNLQALDGPPLSDDVLAACDQVWLSLAGTRFAYNR